MTHHRRTGRRTREEREEGPLLTQRSQEWQVHMWPSWYSILVQGSKVLMLSQRAVCRNGQTLKSESQLFYGHEKARDRVPVTFGLEWMIECKKEEEEASSFSLLSA